MDITISSDNQNYIKKLIESGDYKKADEILNEAIHLHELFQKQSFNNLQNKIKKGMESEDSSLSISDIINKKTKEHIK